MGHISINTDEYNALVIGNGEFAKIMAAWEQKNNVDFCQFMACLFGASPAQERYIADILNKGGAANEPLRDQQ